MSREEEMNTELRKLLSRRYPVRLRYEGEGDSSYVVAEIPDLPGCKTVGKDEQEALSELEDAKETWIKDALERAEPIPEIRDTELSGKFVVRMPRRLHGHLALAAEEEGVSLNAYVVSLLATGSTERCVERRLKGIEDTQDRIKNLLLMKDAQQGRRAPARQTATGVRRLGSS